MVGVYVWKEALLLLPIFLVFIAIINQWLTTPTKVAKSPHNLTALRPKEQGRKQGVQEEKVYCTR